MISLIKIIDVFKQLNRITKCQLNRYPIKVGNCLNIKSVSLSYCVAITDFMLNTRCARITAIPYVRYIIYIMLSTGIVRRQLETPVLDLPLVSPNQRLLNQLSDVLHKLNIDHFRSDICIKPGRQKTVTIPFSLHPLFGSGNLLISSRPDRFKSYVNAIVLNPEHRHEIELDTVNIAFLAQTPLEIIKKLVQYGFLEELREHVE